MTDNLKQDIELIDDALHVPDERSIEMIYRLLDEEGYVNRFLDLCKVIHGCIECPECCCC